MKRFLLPICFLLPLFAAPRLCAQTMPVIVEAELGTRGAEVSSTTEGGVQFVSAASNGGGENPGSTARVLTLSVTFPSAGMYELYLRVRVGAGGANDDSFFYGSGFGTKVLTTDGDWVTVNGLATVGFTESGDTVTGAGTAGAGVWKWVKISEFNGGDAPLRFLVEGTLTRTLLLGMREDGLQIDKLAFGRHGASFTVGNLDSGAAGAAGPLLAPYTPPGPPPGAGKAKFFGGAMTPGASESVNFEKYFNQLTPGNAGKWGWVERTRDVMTWTDLDASYALAKAHGMPFKMHTMVWGSQQPAWVETLSAAEQLAEIEEWFAAVAARYPDLEMIDVVNEPINDPPNRPGDGGGNYINALGGSGASGWDWVLKSFRMARAYFPRSKLLINEYSVTNSTTRAATYVQIINLLKAEGLIDGVGIQAHSFSTTNSSTATRTNLDAIAATGVPIYISELDIDGPTDQIQLDEFKRIFPIFWEHPAVVGVTLWGYRPGMWRSNQGAYLAMESGAERPAFKWLQEYVAASPAGGPLIWNQPRAQNVIYGSSASFSVWATGATAYQWLKDGAPVPGATGATLQLGNVQPGDAGSYQVLLTGPGGTSLSTAVTLTASPPGASKLVNIATRAYVGQGGDVLIAGFVIGGSTPKTLLVRASGPALTKLSVPGVLADPTVDLYSGSNIIFTNDNWGDDAAKKAEILTAAQSVGAFDWDNGSKDAALLVTLNPGAYTAIVSGKGGGQGVALVEAYEVDGSNAGAKLINIATRSLVRTGAEVQIAGFVIRGSGPKQVLIRASGPALARFNVPGLLADPGVEIFSGQNMIASNDNWDAGLRPDFQRFGGDTWEVGSKDAALMLTLQPGAYTAIVSGKNGGIGVALIEVYEAD